MICLIFGDECTDTLDQAVFVLSMVWCVSSEIMHHKFEAHTRNIPVIPVRYICMSYVYSVN